MADKEPEDEFNIEFYDFPQGIYRRDTVVKPIRWPVDLYNDLNKMCQKIKAKKGKTVSVARLVIFVVTQWKEKGDYLSKTFKEKQP